MKTRRRNYSEDSHTVNRQIKREKSSENEGENALPIPIDLIFEIFSRLSVKSIATCRCVSKLWSSILSRREFTDLFSSKSYVRPQLLYVCQYGRELLVFSSPQPQNPGENSPPLIANYHMSFSFDGQYETCGVVNGLVCVKNDKRLPNGTIESVPVICNPSTGEPLHLKKVKTRRKSEVRSLFGYNPIDKGFKVLSNTWGCSWSEGEHQVLTIGTNKWRKFEYCLPGRHRSLDKGLCINGILYTQSVCLRARIYAICCFDLRSEKFSFIKFNETIPYATLINYNDSLGLLWSERANVCFDQRFDQGSTSLRLWVLEDVERQEWSKRIIVLPPLWKYVVGQNILRVVGVTGTNEIVFTTYQPLLFYLNTNKNTIVRVKIQGMDTYIGRIRIFVNHVEDVKLF